MRRKYLFSQQNYTKINDFDEGVLILEPLFLRQCHFQNLLLVFVFQSKSRHFTRGSQTMDNFGTSIVTFETDVGHVAYFENDIASEKTAIESKRLHQNQ